MSVWRWLMGKPTLRTDADDVTDVVIGLIKAGRDWDRGGCVWWHKSGISVWVGNEAYGLGILLGAESWREWASKGDKRKGAVPLTKHHRKRIWSAVRAYVHDEQISDTRAATQATVRKVLEMYDPQFEAPRP